MNVRDVDRFGAVRAVVGGGGRERRVERQMEAAIREVLRGAQLREGRRAPEQALNVEARRTQVVHTLLQHWCDRVACLLLLDAALAGAAGRTSTFVLYSMCSIYICK